MPTVIPAVIGFVASNASWIVPVATTAASVGASMIQANQAEASENRARRETNLAASQAQAKSEALYRELSKPNEAAIAASATENRGALGQARAGAYKNLASELASKGFGSGSGLGVQGASNIESGYLQSLGKQQTELTKYANTPFFGPPSAVYPTGQNYSPTTGAASAGLGVGSSMLDKALGYTMMKNLYGGGGKTSTYKSPYDVDNMQNTWGYPV